MNIRYATEKDLREWFDGAIPTSMRAVVVEKDGRLLGIGGIARNEDHLQAFSRVTNELRPHKVTLGRLAVKVRALMEGLGPLWAVCDPTEPTSPNLLAWCGFEHMQDGVWVRKRSGGA